MKQFIVLIAVLPLLLIFVGQYALDQKNQAVVQYVQEEVLATCEEARLAGCFSKNIQENLRGRLSAALGIDPGSIEMNVTETVKYRINYYDPTGERGMIDYSIRIPIGEQLVGKKLLRITEDTTGYLTLSGRLASERLP